jgi:hypothetical protein
MPDLQTRQKEVAAFLEEGRVVDEWRGKSLLVTLDGPAPTPRWLFETGAEPVYANPTDRVYRVCPAAKSPDRSP